MIFVFIDCMPLVVCVKVRLSVHGCDWVEVDRSLVAVVFRVNWMVAVVDLMLEWGFKVILISMVVFKHCGMGRSSWMPVVKLRVVVGMLSVIIVSLGMVSAPLVVWDVVAHMLLMVSIDPAALVVRLVKVLLIMIMLILVAFHHIGIARMAMNHLIDQAMESSLVMSWLMVMLNKVGSFMMRHFFEGITEFITVLIFRVEIMGMDNSMVNTWKDNRVVRCVVMEVWLWVN